MRFSSFIPLIPILAGLLQADCLATDPIVVFIPGTGGTELVDTTTKKLWWPNPEALRHRLRDGMLSPESSRLSVGGLLRAVEIKPMDRLFGNMNQQLNLLNLEVVQPVISLPVYQRIDEWGQQRFADRWHVVDYDWRWGAGERSAAIIDRVISRAMLQHNVKPGGARIVLLGHSLGGLLARDYVVRRRGKNVDSVITVGTPFLGAPKSARGILQGYHLEFGYTIPPERSNAAVAVYCKVRNKPQRYRSLTILSFVNPEDSKHVARTLPAVHQMLPGEDFQRIYARRSMAGAKSLLVNRTSEEYLGIVRAPNPRLYDAAQQWRADILNGNDYGVRHVVIGAVCSPETSIADHQEMEFCLKQDVKLDNFLAASRRVIWNSIQGIWLDEHIATERHWRWGDSVVPLLSATCGACAMFGDEVDARPARKRLGPNTKVLSVQLAKDMSHPHEMEDPMVLRYVEKEIARVQ